MDLPHDEHAIAKLLAQHFILDQGEVTAVDEATWLAWKIKHPYPMHTGLTLLYKGGQRVRVSTVFMGIPMPKGLTYKVNFFETQVFGGPLDDVVVRYETLAEAVAGHREVVRAVKAQMDFGK